MLHPVVDLRAAGDRLMRVQRNVATCVNNEAQQYPAAAADSSHSSIATTAYNEYGWCYLILNRLRISSTSTAVQIYGDAFMEEFRIRTTVELVGRNR